MLRHVAIGGFFILIGGLGMYVADQLASATTITTSRAAMLERTVERRVTVYREATPARPVAAGFRIITRKVVRYVPKAHVELRTRTAVVTTSRIVTRTAVDTRTVTRDHTVTRTEPRLVTRTVRQSVSVTETAPPITETQTIPPTTVTLPPSTVTLPPATVTVTVTVRGHGH